MTLFLISLIGAVLSWGTDAKAANRREIPPPICEDGEICWVSSVPCYDLAEGNPSLVSTFVGPYLLKTKVTCVAYNGVVSSIFKVSYEEVMSVRNSSSDTLEAVRVRCEALRANKLTLLGKCKP